MPPKKKPRRKVQAKQVRTKSVKQPLQKQTQKQVVNIKIGDGKKKKKRRRRVAKQSQITPLAGNLGNTLNMGIYSDLSRLNTLENLINRLIPQTISKPITASIPTQTTMLGTGTTTQEPTSSSELDFIAELEGILEKGTQPSPSETAKRTPVKTTPPPKLKRESSISSLSSDEETIGLPRRGTDYLSTGTDTTRDLQTIDEMNLGASGFGDF